MASSVVSMACSSSASAAAPVAPPAHAPGATVLLLRGKSAPFHVKLPPEASPPSSQRARDLLQRNPSLREALKVKVSQDGVYSVKDYALRDAHMLLRLSEWQRAHPLTAPRRLRVAILWYAHLNPWFDISVPLNERRAALSLEHGGETDGWIDLLHPSSGPHAASPAAAAPAAAAPAAASSVSSIASSPPRPTAPPLLQYRVCSSLAEALAAGHPLRVIFLPNLMWYTKLLPLNYLETGLDELLAAVRARQRGQAVVLYPPRAWDQLLEIKHLVYVRFQSIMLPSVVVPMQSFDASGLQDTARTLMARCPDGGVYVVKGVYSDCAQAVASIHLPPTELRSFDPPPPLTKALADMWHGFKQTVFIMQKRVPFLRTHEYRHWYLALPDAGGGPRQFRLVAAIRSTYSSAKPPVLTASPSAPLDPPSIACFDLAQRIMTANDNPLFTNFRAELLGMGCFALRIDCGFDPATQRAFVNELTAPADAAIFTFVHETDLVFGLADMLAEGVSALL